MFNAGTETVKDLHADIVAELDYRISGFKVVVLRIGRIKVHQRKDEVGIHYTLSGVAQRPVMGTGSVKIHPQKVLILGGAGEAAGKIGGVTITVQGVAQGSGFAVKVHMY